MPDNIVIHYFIKGGWVMWPILLTSIVAASVILERAIWWTQERRKRDSVKLEKIYVALEEGDVKQASALAQDSRDPILRVIWHGLNHHHASLEGALQVAAGIEISRAGRFLVVLDTIVTLAPLLGLLGTVTGLMRAFFKLGDVELSEQAIGGGIGEALIATASGLVIAVIALIALNYFSARVARFQFDLQTAATNTEVLTKTALAEASLSSAATDSIANAVAKAITAALKQKENIEYENRFTAAA
jgi:biopolymer transport protein ExbB